MSIPNCQREIECLFYTCSDWCWNVSYSTEEIVVNGMDHEDLTAIFQPKKEIQHSTFSSC